MALNLYRRHRRKCSAGHEEDSKSGELQERRKGWKRCGCPITAAGVLNRKFDRRNTDQTAWERAKAVAESWEKAGMWDGTPSAPPVPEPAAETDHLMTVDRAVKAFIDEHKEHSARNTIRKYMLITDKLKRYSESLGYISLNRWGPNDVREFRSSWKVGAQTAAKNMSVVKSFFQFCLANEWMDRNPAKLVKNLRGRSSEDTRNQQKLPFTEDELKRIYECCDTQYGKQEVKWSRVVHHHRVEGEYARYNLKWTGQDLADFISVSTYTGLRISDVATFNINRMKATGEVHIRTTKSGTHVYTWVPEWLQERIRARAQERGPLIFGEHKTQDMNVVTDLWRRKLKKLWSLCGPWPEPPTPHRFRHTFARILLERPGVEVRDVAELLGNSAEMVRKHYAAWVPERQERLTRVLKAAFGQRTKPKLVEMPKMTGSED
jgi:integrase